MSESSFTLSGRITKDVINDWIRLSVIIYGPSGTGKTRNADRFVRHFGLVGGEHEFSVQSRDRMRRQFIRAVGMACGPVLFTTLDIGDDEIVAMHRNGSFPNRIMSIREAIDVIESADRSDRS